MNYYNPTKIECKWQKIWSEKQSHQSEINSKKKKFYVLEMFPYPSKHSYGLRNYTIGDVVSRFYKLLDFNVLHPMGWDNFGMPAENRQLRIKLVQKNGPKKT